MGVSVEQHEGPESPARPEFPSGSSLSTKLQPSCRLAQLKARSGCQLDSKGKESVSWSLWTTPDRFRVMMEEEDGVGARQARHRNKEYQLQCRRSLGGRRDLRLWGLQKRSGILKKEG